jgi:O-antigen ligase
MIVIYYLLVKLKAQNKINFIGKLMPIATVVVVLGIASSAFLFSQYPEIIDKIEASVSDIENYDKQGTGGWRMTQIKSYIPFVEENFVFGMRFAGFELPIQFYREDIDAPVFEDGNGHFFHSFYLEIFFYLGLIGMILFLIPTLYAILRGIKMETLNTNQIILYAFACSGFVFGLSYVLPPFYYGCLGLCLALLEKDSEEQTSYLLDFADRMRQKRKAHQKQLIT